MEDAREHRRSIWGLIIIAVSAAVVMLILSTDAVADPDDCPDGSGWVCMYKNVNFGAGGVAQYSGNDTNYVGNTFDDCAAACALNNATSSIWNSGNTHESCHYRNADYGGASIRTVRDTGWGNLANTNFGDNQASSHRFRLPGVSCIG